MKAVMVNSVRLLGCSLELRQGQSVDVIPATNQPEYDQFPRRYFAKPADGTWSDSDSILIDELDLMKESPNRVH